LRSPALISRSSNPECHAVLASLSERYPPLKGRSPTRYSPVRHSTQDRSPFRVRLACVRHAASVDSEPGSNSQVKVVVHAPPCGRTRASSQTRGACRLFLFVTSSCRPAIGSRLRSNLNGTADTRRAGLIRLRSRLRSSFGGLCVHALSSFQRTGVDGLAAVRGPPCAQRSSGEPYELTTPIPAVSSRKMRSAEISFRPGVPSAAFERAHRRVSCRPWRRASGALPQTGGNASSTNRNRNDLVTCCQATRPVLRKFRAISCTSWRRCQRRTLMTRRSRWPFRSTTTCPPMRSAAVRCAAPSVSRRSLA
jgi:hypothetical protein